jgi:hypothetical protein
MSKIAFEFTGIAPTATMLITNNTLTITETPLSDTEERNYLLPLATCCQPLVHSLTVTRQKLLEELKNMLA